MSDYIEREKAIEYFMINTNWHDEDGYSIDDWDEKRKLLEDYFNGVPSADVQPVVRCKDCVFRNRYKFPPKYEERDYCDENMRSVEANDFCKWGIERSR